jgi:acetyl-CoA/propionyl-CoA carboxylase carboxyl transferase subunit
MTAPQARPVPGQPGRDPMDRLGTLFDADTLSLLLPADASGVLAGEGEIGGIPAVAFASDPRVQGGALGSAGCMAIVTAYDRAI